MLSSVYFNVIKWYYKYNWSNKCIGVVYFLAPVLSYTLTEVIWIYTYYNLGLMGAEGQNKLHSALLKRKVRNVLSHVSDESKRPCEGCFVNTPPTEAALNMLSGSSEHFNQTVNHIYMPLYKFNTHAKSGMVTSVKAWKVLNAWKPDKAFVTICQFTQWFGYAEKAKSIFCFVTHMWFL